METQNTTGRRPKLTPSRYKRIVSALKTGNFVTVAAAYGGIGRTTFYRWMNRGQAEGRGRFYRFYKAVRRALAHAEVHAVGVIRTSHVDELAGGDDVARTAASSAVASGEAIRGGSGSARTHPLPAR